MFLTMKNAKLLNEDFQAQNPPKKEPVCKCGGACNLNGRCVDNDLVYSSQLTLAQTGEVKEYLGSTSQQARSRISQHSTDSKYEKYKNRTIFLPLGNLQKNAKKMHSR